MRLRFNRFGTKRVWCTRNRISKKTQAYFESLDEQTQIDILENYENRGQRSWWKGTTNSKSESKNEVFLMERRGEGAKPKPTIKERVAEQ
jgi:hypothetical protein